MRICFFFTKYLFLAILLLTCALPAIGQKTKRKRTVPQPNPVNVNPAFDNEKITVEKAKQPCTAKIADLPEIRGLRLGMTTGEVLELLPRLRTSRAGWSALVTEATLTTPSFEESLRGIKTFNAFLLEDKLASFRFEYEPEVKWNSIQEYAARLSENFKVSPENWTYSSGHIYVDSLTGAMRRDGKKAELECQDFYVEASLDSTYKLLVQVRNFDGQVLQAEKRLEDEKKRKFKP